MHRMLYTTIILLLSVTVFAEDENIPGEINKVKVERAAATGAGRLYMVTLEGDGTALYVGDRDVQQLGIFHLNFPEQDFRDLASYLVAIDYRSLSKQNFESGYDGLITRITVWSDESDKARITLQNTSPPKICAVVRLVDSILSELWDNYSMLAEEEKTPPREIVLPEFSWSGTLQGFAEELRREIPELDPAGEGINLVLRVPEKVRTEHNIRIETKDKSVASILNRVAARHGLYIIKKGRTFIIQKRQGAL